MMNKIKLKIYLILGISLVTFILVIFVIINLFQVVFFWKSPFFASTNYDGILQKAIDSRDPSQCEKLAQNLGDSNPRSKCYINAIGEIGDISMCDTYLGAKDLGFYVNSCKQMVGIKKVDISVCGSGDVSDRVNLNKYNSCVSTIAAETKMDTLCKSIKEREGANATQSTCLANIVTQNMFSGPITISTPEAISICEKIPTISDKNYCFNNIILATQDATQCKRITISSSTDMRVRNLCNK